MENLSDINESGGAADAKLKHLGKGKIRTLYKKAIKSVPNEQLRRELEAKRKGTIRELLVQFEKEGLLKIAENVVQKGAIRKDSSRAVKTRKSEKARRIPYNVFFSRVKLNSEKVKSYEEKERRTVCELYLVKKMQMDQNVDLAELLKEYKEASPCDVMDWRSETALLCRCYLASKCDLELLKKIMLKYCADLLNEYSELAPEGELADSADQQRMCELRNHTLGMLKFFHATGASCDTAEGSRPGYADIMAALLSTYSDQVLVLARARQKTKKKGRRRLIEHLSMALCYYTAGRRHYCLDAILQLSHVTAADVDIVLPLATKVLDSLSVTSEGIYTKYVLTARMLRQTFGAHADTLVQKCCKMAAPQGYLKWLSMRDASIHDQLPVTKKFKGDHITSFLINESDDALAEKLLEVLTTGEGQQAELPTAAEQAAGPAQSKAEDAAPVQAESSGKGDSDLFYIDTSAPGGSLSQKKLSQRQLREKLFAEKPADDVSSAVEELEADEQEETGADVMVSDEETDDRDIVVATEKKLSRIVSETTAHDDSESAKVKDGDMESEAETTDSGTEGQEVMGDVIDEDEGQAVADVPMATEQADVGSDSSEGQEVSDSVMASDDSEGEEVKDKAMVTGDNSTDAESNADEKENSASSVEISRFADGQADWEIHFGTNGVDLSVDSELGQILKYDASPKTERLHDVSLTPIERTALKTKKKKKKRRTRHSLFGSSVGCLIDAYDKIISGDDWMPKAACACVDSEPLDNSGSGKHVDSDSSLNELIDVFSSESDSELLCSEKDKECGSAEDQKDQNKPSANESHAVEFEAPSGSSAAVKARRITKDRKRKRRAKRQRESSSEHTRAASSTLSESEAACTEQVGKGPPGSGREIGVVQGSETAPRSIPAEGANSDGYHWELLTRLDKSSPVAQLKLPERRVRRKRREAPSVATAAAAGVTCPDEVPLASVAGRSPDHDVMRGAVASRDADAAKSKRTSAEDYSSDVVCPHTDGAVNDATVPAVRDSSSKRKKRTRNAMESAETALGDVVEADSRSVRSDRDSLKGRTGLVARKSDGMGNKMGDSEEPVNDGGDKIPPSVEIDVLAHAGIQEASLDLIPGVSRDIIEIVAQGGERTEPAAVLTTCLSRDRLEEHPCDCYNQSGAVYGEQAARKKAKRKKRKRSPESTPDSPFEHPSDDRQTGSDVNSAKERSDAPSGDAVVQVHSSVAAERSSWKKSRQETSESGASSSSERPPETGLSPVDTNVVMGNLPPVGELALKTGRSAAGTNVLKSGTWSLSEKKKLNRDAKKYNATGNVTDSEHPCTKVDGERSGFGQILLPTLTLKNSQEQEVKDTGKFPAEEISEVQYSNTISDQSMFKGDGASLGSLERGNAVPCDVTAYLSSRIKSGVELSLTREDADAGSDVGQGDVTPRTAETTVVPGGTDDQDDVTSLDAGLGHGADETGSDSGGARGSSKPREESSGTSNVEADAFPEASSEESKMNSSKKRKKRRREKKGLRGAGLSSTGRDTELNLSFELPVEENNNLALQRVEKTGGELRPVVCEEGADIQRSCRDAQGESRDGSKDKSRDDPVSELVDEIQGQSRDETAACCRIQYESLDEIQGEPLGDVQADFQDDGIKGKLSDEDDGWLSDSVQGESPVGTPHDPCDGKKDEVSDEREEQVMDEILREIYDDIQGKSHKGQAESRDRSHDEVQGDSSDGVQGEFCNEVQGESRVKQQQEFSPACLSPEQQTEDQGSAACRAGSPRLMVGSPSSLTVPGSLLQRFDFAECGVDEATEVPTENGSPENSVDASPEGGVDVSPEGGVDVSPEGGVGASSESRIQRSQTNRVDASPEVGVDASPKSGGDAPTDNGVDMSPEKDVDARSSSECWDSSDYREQHSGLSKRGSTEEPECEYVDNSLEGALGTSEQAGDEVKVAPPGGEDVVIAKVSQQDHREDKTGRGQTEVAEIQEAVPQSPSRDQKATPQSPSRHQKAMLQSPSRVQKTTQVQSPSRVPITVLQSPCREQSVAEQSTNRGLRTMLDSPCREQKTMLQSPSRVQKTAQLQSPGRMQATLLQSLCREQNVAEQSPNRGQRTVLHSPSRVQETTQVQSPSRVQITVLQSPCREQNVAEQSPNRGLRTMLDSPSREQKTMLQSLSRVQKTAQIQLPSKMQTTLLQSPCREQSVAEQSPNRGQRTVLHSPSRVQETTQVQSPNRVQTTALQSPCREQNVAEQSPNRGQKTAQVQSPFRMQTTALQSPCREQNIAELSASRARNTVPQSPSRARNTVPQSPSRVLAALTSESPSSAQKIKQNAAKLLELARSPSRSVLRTGPSLSLSDSDVDSPDRFSRIIQKLDEFALKSFISPLSSSRVASCTKKELAFVLSPSESEGCVSESTADLTDIVSPAGAEDGVPPTGDNVPLTEDNVPLAEDNVPLTDENVPPAEDNVPLTKENVPLAEDSVAVTDENMPPAEDNVRNTNENVPPLECNVRRMDENVLHSEDHAPLTDVNVPSAEDNVPLTDVNVPSAEDNVPLMDENLGPAGGKGQDDAGKILSDADENMRSVDENMRLVEENMRPVEENVRPTVENVRPTDAFELPEGENERYRSDSFRPENDTIPISEENMGSVIQNFPDESDVVCPVVSVFTKVRSRFGKTYEKRKLQRAGSSEGINKSIGECCGFVNDSPGASLAGGEPAGSVPTGMTWQVWGGNEVDYAPEMPAQSDADTSAAVPLCTRALSRIDAESAGMPESAASATPEKLHVKRKRTETPSKSSDVYEFTDSEQDSSNQLSPFKHVYRTRSVTERTASPVQKTGTPQGLRKEVAKNARDSTGIPEECGEDHSASSSPRRLRTRRRVAEIADRASAVSGSGSAWDSFEKTEYDGSHAEMCGAEADYRSRSRDRVAYNLRIRLKGFLARNSPAKTSRSPEKSVSSPTKLSVGSSSINSVSQNTASPSKSSGSPRTLSNSKRSGSPSKMASSPGRFPNPKSPKSPSGIANFPSHNVVSPSKTAISPGKMSDPISAKSPLKSANSPRKMSNPRCPVCPEKCATSPGRVRDRQVLSPLLNLSTPKNVTVGFAAEVPAISEPRQTSAVSDCQPTDAHDLDHAGSGSARKDTRRNLAPEFAGRGDDNAHGERRKSEQLTHSPAPKSWKEAKSGCRLCDADSKLRRLMQSKGIHTCEHECPASQSKFSSLTSHSANENSSAVKKWVKVCFIIEGFQEIVNFGKSTRPCAKNRKRVQVSFIDDDFQTMLSLEKDSSLRKGADGIECVVVRTGRQLNEALRLSQKSSPHISSQLSKLLKSSPHISPRLSDSQGSPQKRNRIHSNDSTELTKSKKTIRVGSDNSPRCTNSKKSSLVHRDDSPEVAYLYQNVPVHTESHKLPPLRNTNDRRHKTSDKSLLTTVVKETSENSNTNKSRTKDVSNETMTMRDAADESMTSRKSSATSKAKQMTGGRSRSKCDKTKSKIKPEVTPTRMTTSPTKFSIQSETLTKHKEKSHEILTNSRHKSSMIWTENSDKLNDRLIKSENAKTTKKSSGRSMSEQATKTAVVSRSRDKSADAVAARRVWDQPRLDKVRAYTTEHSGNTGLHDSVTGGEMRTEVRQMLPNTMPKMSSKPASHSRHQSDKKFTCPVCGKGCVSEMDLVIHLDRSSPEQPLSCRRKAFLKTGKRLSVKCPTCGCEYSRFKAHACRPLTCRACGKVYASLSALEAHPCALEMSGKWGQSMTCMKCRQCLPALEFLAHLCVSDDVTCSKCDKVYKKSYLHRHKCVPMIQLYEQRSRSRSPHEERKRNDKSGGKHTDVGEFSSTDGRGTEGTDTSEVFSHNSLNRKGVKMTEAPNAGRNLGTYSNDTVCCPVFPAKIERVDVGNTDGFISSVPCTAPNRSLRLDFVDSRSHVNESFMTSPIPVSEYAVIGTVQRSVSVATEWTGWWAGSEEQSRYTPLSVEEQSRYTLLSTEEQSKYTVPEYREFGHTNGNPFNDVIGFSSNQQQSPGNGEPHLHELKPVFFDF